MRQNSKVEPSTLSSPAIALHPVLSLALVNLDMQLEDELVRYRRQRANGGRAVPQARRKQPSQQLDLIAVAATSDRNSANTTQPIPALEDRLMDVAGQPIAPDTYKPIPAFTANPQPFDTAIALRTPAMPPAQGGSADSSLAAERDEAHTITPAADPNLGDYLESSEELLRSLADEQAEVRAERNFMQSLLTPLGLGSMLLLLLSSAMFGYVIMNPSSLGSLAKLNQSSSAPGQPPVPAAPPLPPNPANSALPFLDPNNLGVLDPGRSSLPSSIQPTVTPTGKPAIASPTTAAPTSPVELSRSQAPSAPPQAPIPAVTSAPSRPSTVRTVEPSQPAPRRFAPAQAPVATVRPAPLTNPSAASSGNGAGVGSYQYKVGIPFENDQTLENARKVVPDAFVRTLPDGRTIVQLGAARSETEVKTNVQKLHDQGLPSAEIYKR
ncbi:MAG: hypothetical protein KME42_11185 [Tildeniella nuda ZEHNDER 1965/U140]|jgi:hypothetical protein|nr:hypothetical protein [Tildeniella nuda ZEHNDER 1965/U140]